MKLFRPVKQVCIETLYGIFFEGRYAEKAVDFHLRIQKKWGARDRRHFAELIYDIVRNARMLSALAPARLNLADIFENKFILNPEEAKAGLSNLIDFYIEYREKHGLEILPPATLPRTIRFSLPDHFDRWGVEEFGQNWDMLIAKLNERAPQFIRVNDLKTNKEKLIADLQKLEIKTEQVNQVPSALKLMARTNVFITPVFKNGDFEMQDAGSQLIAPFLEVSPGMRVIDACAGGGGKTLHLADLMGNKGQIIALDIHEPKLKELKLRARRAGVHIIETRPIESQKTIKRLSESADRVLLDVPCSGIGVLRRHPDTKWKFDKTVFDYNLKLQEQILNEYSNMVKVGGKLVYATCSLAPSENQLQIQKFLKLNSQFTLEKEMEISPLNSEFDGFYAARLIRSK